MILVWWQRVLTAFAVLAGLMLAGTAILVAVGIMSRFFFGRPIGWASEVSGYSLMYITFLAAPWILTKEGHVSLDLVVDAISPRNAAIMHSLTSVAGAIVFSFLAYLGAASTWVAFVRDYPMATMLAFPRYLLLVAIPIGCGLLAIEFLHRAYRFWMRRNGNAESTPQERIEI